MGNINLVNKLTVITNFAEYDATVMLDLLSVHFALIFYSLYLV